MQIALGCFPAGSSVGLIRAFWRPLSWLCVFYRLSDIRWTGIKRIRKVGNCDQDQKSNFNCTIEQTRNQRISTWLLPVPPIYCSSLLRSNNIPKTLRSNCSSAGIRNRLSRPTSLNDPITQITRPLEHPSTMQQTTCSCSSTGRKHTFGRYSATSMI
jgi:hypothetical protein